MDNKPPWAVQIVYRASGIVESICEHGCGHPTIESAKRVAERYGHPIETWLSHGCDGCCSREDFPGE